MLKNHINDLLINNFEFIPTDGQKDVLKKLAEFIVSPEDISAFVLKGYAGTGKTTLVRSIILSLAEFNHQCVLMAPTGRAAKVLTSYTGKPAFTIHKKIYRQKSSTGGIGTFNLDRNLHDNTLFIVDEASMIGSGSNENSIFGTGSLLDDLIEYVFNGRGCRLLLIGDTAQLPPIGVNISPALDVSSYTVKGIEVNHSCLTEVLRQSESSGILVNATNIREQIELKSNFKPNIRLEGYKDIENINGADLLDKISESYDKVGIEQTIILCRSNKRANAYNVGIRNRILWREEEISTGDLIMIVKNNYFWIPENKEIEFIANGDIAEIIKIYGFQEQYGFRFADICVKFADYNDLELDVKIILDTLISESASLSSTDLNKLYVGVLEDYADVSPRKLQYEKVKNDPWYNALQIKFAYAVTCHKAQGGQWDIVFVDQGYITDEMMGVEYLRWLYTAFTRAIKQLYLINFKIDE